MSIQALSHLKNVLNIFIGMYWPYRGFHWDISIYVYNVPWLGPSPPSFSLILLPPT
jgi:hypothetical protein